jgi:neutral amino acid transport system substrate-binding protein
MKRLIGSMVVLAGCVSSGGSYPADAIPVGALLPFTGALAANGTNLERALYWVAEQINQNGGISGRQIRLVATDTFSDTQRGLDAAHRLIEQDHVVAIIGPEEGALASALLPLLPTDKVALVSGGINLPELSQMASGGYFFRTTPSLEALGRGLAHKMYVDDGVRTAAVVHDSDEYGVSFGQIVADQFTGFGGTVTAVISLSSGQSSFSSEIRAGTAGSPEAVVLVTYPNVGAELTQEWTATAGPTHWYLSPSLKTDVFVENAGPGVLDNAAGVAAAVASDSDLFVARFRDRWSGDIPLSEAYFYYDAMALVALAMQAGATMGQTPDGDAVRLNIRAVSVSPMADRVAWFELPSGLATLRRGLPIDYRGASGGVDLDANGEVGSGLLRLWSVVNDHIVDGDVRVIQ